MKIVHGVVNGCVSSSSDVLQNCKPIHHNGYDLKSTVIKNSAETIDMYQLSNDIKGKEGVEKGSSLETSTTELSNPSILPSSTTHDDVDSVSNSVSNSGFANLQSDAVSHTVKSSITSGSIIASTSLNSLSSSTSPKQINLTKDDSSVNAPVVTSPSIHVVLPSNSSMLSSTSPVSQNQRTVVTAFLAPVQTSPKKSVASSVSSSVSSSARIKPSQQSMVHATTLSGTKILVAQPSSVVNGQLRQNVVPVTSAGATILLAQGSSMLSVPTKTITTSSGMNVGTCVNLNSVGPRKYVTSSGTTLTIPYTQANIVRTTTLPIGASVNLTNSVPSTTGHHSLPIAFSITPSKAVSTSSSSSSTSVSHALSPVSTSKHSPFTVHNNGNKVVVNLKQRMSQHSNNVHSTHASSSHKYYGLPYQDHNYGAPPPPTPPQSPSPPPPEICFPKQETIESSVISVDEDTNTSLASSVSTETALSTNGDDVEITVSSTVPDISHIIKAPTPSDDQSITRCICEFNHDDEYMICCDKCLVWQHVDCMGINRNEIPDTYLCERCFPRKIDIRRAKSLQSKKRGKLRPVNCNSDTSSADESKDENRQKQTVNKIKKLKKKDQKTEKFTLRKKKERKIKEEMKIDVKRANLRQKKKCRSNSLNGMDEDTRDSWDNGMLREWIDKYEEALINQYTPEIQLQVSTLQLNGKNEELVKRATKQLRAQLCRVAWNATSGRRLLSSCDIECNQSIIEYRGKFSSLSQFKEQNPVFSNKSYPFVLFYSPGVDEEDVCVDAREYGNTARFVRRSCTPNAEVRHVVENGLLHLYLFSICKIPKDEEITISFDFNYRKCVNKVECACSKEKCPVATVIVKKNGLNNLPNIEREKKRHLRKKSEVLVEEIDDKPPPVKHQKPPQSPVKPVKKPVSPLKISHSNNVSVQQEENTEETNHTAAEDDSTDPANDKKHKMTREERKMEAIMKAFERMEKTEKRRQQALERIAQKHVPDADGEKSNQLETKELNCGQDVTDIVNNETTSSVPTNVMSPGPTPTLEDSLKLEDGHCDEQSKSSQTQKLRKGKKRKSSGTPSKRRLRTVSGSSDQSAVLSSADESGYITSFGTISTPNTPFPPESDPFKMSPMSGNCPFRFPKTKKSMMSEWLHEKSDQPNLLSPTFPPTSPLSVKVDCSSNYPQYPLVVSDYFHAGNQTCYIRNTRGSNSGINVAHLRRNSCSEKEKVINNSESNMGSAKKRWLRQVMHEEEVEQETPTCSTSPLHSPCSSPPTDSITPLKKRRLMRESMSSDISTPSSPCVMNSPGVLCDRVVEHIENKTEKVIVVDVKMEDGDGAIEDSHSVDLSKPAEVPNLNSSIESSGMEVVHDEEEETPSETKNIDDLSLPEFDSDVNSNQMQPVINSKDKSFDETVIPDKMIDATDAVDLENQKQRTILECKSLTLEEISESNTDELSGVICASNEEHQLNESVHCDDNLRVDDVLNEVMDTEVSPDDNSKASDPPASEVTAEMNEVKVECNEDTASERQLIPHTNSVAMEYDVSEMKETCINMPEDEKCLLPENDQESIINLEIPHAENEEDCMAKENEEVEVQEDKSVDISSIKHNFQVINESSPHITPIKRKVSLSEYRLRKNLSKPSTNSVVSPSHSKGSSLSESLTATPDSNSTSPINILPLPISLMTPGKSPPKLSTLPLFKTMKEEKRLKASKNIYKSSFKDKSSDVKSSRSEEHKFDEEEVHWNNTPSSIEKITEQQRENLTQRLKREFGLLSDTDIQPSSGGDSGSDDKDQSSLIPPPPPKPPGGHFHAQAYKSVPPPPPPPRRPPTAQPTTHQYHNTSFSANNIRFPANTAAAVYPHPPSTFVQNQPVTSYSISGQPTTATVPQFIPQMHPHYPPQQSQLSSHPAPTVLVYPAIQMQTPFLGQANTCGQMPNNYPYGKDCN